MKVRRNLLRKKQNVNLYQEEYWKIIQIAGEMTEIVKVVNE